MRCVIVLNETTTKKKIDHDQFDLDYLLDVNEQSMIEGWHRRSAAILTEHQNQLEKFTKIEHVEKTKQFLLIKNYLYAEEAEQTSSSPKSACATNKVNKNKPF